MPIEVMRKICEIVSIFRLINGITSVLRAKKKSSDMAGLEKSVQNLLTNHMFLHFLQQNWESNSIGRIGVGRRP